MGVQQSRNISIHTPLAGSDRKSCHRLLKWMNFNPHSPCGERRLILPSRVLVSIFQSTLPLRGATGHTRHHPNIPCYFNPHSPCGERPASVKKGAQNVKFQSTLPLRGATAEQLLRLQTNSFQSTLPLRGATRVHVRDAVLDLDVISIHTPLAGSDIHGQRVEHVPPISIHTPLAGSDRDTCPPTALDKSFQSTLPLRGATRRVEGR